MNFNDFTLIISAYERRDTLPFILSFYRETGVKVLLIDSSKKSYKFINNFPWINYHHLPNANFYEAINYAVIQAGTKYICWNNDDDIILPIAIFECLDFLKKDLANDYSNVIGLQSKINSDYGFEEFKIWTQKNFFSKKYNKRIEYMFKNFHTPVHAVCRANIFIDATNLVINNPSLQPIRFFDRIFGIVASVYGNKKVLPIHFCLRSDDRIINSLLYPTYLKRNIKPIELVNLLKDEDCISKWASKLLKLSEIDMHKNLIKILEKYVK